MISNLIVEIRLVALDPKRCPLSLRCERPPSRMNDGSLVPVGIPRGWGQRVAPRRRPQLDRMPTVNWQNDARDIVGFLGRVEIRRPRTSPLPRRIV